jgi:NAD(P)-dependent dehydrogenase (short-subunit alcohol dehydrogenase family)
MGSRSASISREFTTTQSSLVTRVSALLTHFGVIENQGEDMGYRMSKTAMNQMGVTLAKEFQAAGDKIAVVSIYPGYLPTRLSNWRSRQDMDECIKSVVDLIEQIDLSQSGNIVNWKNEPMLL